MSTRALLWLGSLALLTQAWIAKPWLSPPGSAAPAPSTATQRYTTVTTIAPAEVVAELRLGDWTLSLRRQPAAVVTSPTPPPRMT
jgi:hypothetical protein